MIVLKAFAAMTLAFVITMLVICISVILSSKNFKKDMKNAIQEVSIDLPFYGIRILCTWENVIDLCERLRVRFNETKDERYFIELVRLLPNSYKVVKL